MSEETYTADIGACKTQRLCFLHCRLFQRRWKFRHHPRVPNPTIKLTLEDDTVLECAVLTTFPVEGFGEYIALVPLNKTERVLKEKLTYSVFQKRETPLL